MLAITVLLSVGLMSTAMINSPVLFTCYEKNVPAIICHFPLRIAQHKSILLSHVKSVTHALVSTTDLTKWESDTFV